MTSLFQWLQLGWEKQTTSGSCPTLSFTCWQEKVDVRRGKLAGRNKDRNNCLPQCLLIACPVYVHPLGLLGGASATAAAALAAPTRYGQYQEYDLRGAIYARGRAGQGDRGWCNKERSLTVVAQLTPLGYMLSLFAVFHRVAGECSTRASSRRLMMSDLSSLL